MKRRFGFRVLWLGVVCGLLSLLSGCYFGLVTPMVAPVYVEMPIDLSKAGNTAEAEFRIWFEDSYQLDLRIHSLKAFYDEQLNRYLRGDRYWCEKHDDPPLEIGYIGEKGEINKGVNIPLHIVIWKKTGKSEHIVIDDIVSTSDMQAHNSEELVRRVKIYDLEPGKYRISVTNIDDHRRLVGYDAIMYLYYWRR